MKNRFTRNQIAVILLFLALAKSLILALIISPSYGPDGASYMIYSEAFENPDSEEFRWYIRGTTPVYPMFAYVLYHLGGIYLVVLVQIFLGALVAVILYLALHPIDNHAALIAGLLVALDPQTGLFYQLVSTEGLYIALLGLGTAAFFWATQYRPLPQTFLIGVLLGLGSFTRPVGTLLIVPYLFFFILMTRSIKRTTLLGAGYVAIYLGLSLFNLWRFDFFAPSSANGFYLATRLLSVGGLYSPENGAESERLYQLAQACDLELTDASDKNLKVVQDLRLCLIYTHEMPQEEISTLYQNVYSEATRAKPMIFVETMLTQIADFGLLLSAPYDWENTRNLMANCEAEPVDDTGWEVQDMFCPPKPRPLAFIGEGFYAATLAFSLFTLAVHFGLAAVAFPVSQPRVRWLFLYCLGLYAYHAVITAAAGTILPRYITVTNTYLLMTFAFASVTLWKHCRASLKS